MAEPSTIDINSKGWQGKMLGRFKLTRLIGQGAMGKVFRAEDVTLRRQVALKIFPQQITRGQRTFKVEQFIREARSAAQIEHPHVVHIYEVGKAAGWYYIAMELLEGGSLQELVTAGGPMDQYRACSLCADAAEGLAHAHRMGIVHRDIKPANLMLTRAGRCKLTDFGLARFEDPNDPFSLPSEAVGTPLYVAPEVAIGTPATAQSDIYGLGATLWFLLTGKPPFLGKTQKEVLLKHRNEPLPDLLMIRPDLSRSLGDALQKSMAKQPDGRYLDADQFAKVLRAHTIPVGSSAAVAVMPGGLSQTGLRPISASGSYASVSGSHMAVSGSQQSVGGSLLETNQKQRMMILGGVAAIVAVMIGLAIWSVISQVPDRPERGDSTGTAVVSSGSGGSSAGGGTGSSRPPAVQQGGGSRAGQQPVGANWSTVAVERTLNMSRENDRTTIRLLAVEEATKSPSNRRIFAVEGKVFTASVSPSGKVAEASFYDAQGTDQFVIVWFPQTFSGMQARFGGESGSGLTNRSIRVKGRLNVYSGKPQIIVEDPEQVSLLD